MPREAPPMTSRRFMDRLGNLPLLGPVFAFVADGFGIAGVFVKWCWRKVTGKGKDVPTEAQDELDRIYARGWAGDERPDVPNGGD
jgi:hypothetical protein